MLYFLGPTPYSEMEQAKTRAHLSLNPLLKMVVKKCIMGERRRQEVSVPGISARAETPMSLAEPNPISC